MPKLSASDTQGGFQQWLWSERRLAHCIPHLQDGGFFEVVNPLQLPGNVLAQVLHSLRIQRKIAPHFVGLADIPFNATPGQHGVEGIEAVAGEKSDVGIVPLVGEGENIP